MDRMVRWTRSRIGGGRRDCRRHALAKRQRACADIGTEQIPDRYLTPRTVKFRLDVLAELPPGFFATFWEVLFGFPVLGLRANSSPRAFLPPPTRSAAFSVFVPTGSAACSVFVPTGSAACSVFAPTGSAACSVFRSSFLSIHARLGIELLRRPSRSRLRRLLRCRRVLLRPARAVFRDREPRFARCPSFLAELVLVRGRVRAMRR